MLTLDDLIEKRGEGYTAFSARAGIPAFTLRRIRQGLIACPRIATVAKLAAALGITSRRCRALIARYRKETAK